MNGTVRLKASEITKDWHVIDAAGRPLGRVATEAATLLRGKHKPTFEPHLDGGDFVIIVNASKVTLSGKKAQQRKFYRHSGYPGGLKTRSWDEEFSVRPDRVLEQTVWGMLPKGALGEQMFRHLKVYRGAEHPHQSQVTGAERASAKREQPAYMTAGPTMRKIGFRPLSPGQSESLKPTLKQKKAAAAAEESVAEPVAEAIADAAQAPVDSVQEAPIAEAAVEQAKPARRTRAPKAEASTAAVETEAAAATDKTEPAAPARRSRAKASPEGEVAATAEAKPARKPRATKAAATEPATGATTAEAPKPARKPRAKKAATTESAADGVAEEKPKPTRSRKAAETTEE